MSFGVDARAASDEPGGRGRYVRELLRALARRRDDHRYVLYGRERWQAAHLDRRFAWELDRARDPIWHAVVARRASHACAAYLSTNSYLTAWMLRTPSAIVVHDMVAFRSGNRAQRRSGAIERATLRLAVARARAIVCVSESTRRDLVERYPAAASKARVIPLAADPAFAPGAPGDAAARHGIDRPYVLAAGTLEPRKNLPRLIEAFAALPAGLRDSHLLVLVGASGWETAQTLSSIAANPGVVRKLGFVTDDELAELYRGARVAAYPSLYEGFGLPVLEAMQSGTPVLTSNVSSLPEVGGDAAYYVDPRDVRSIRDGLAELLADAPLRAELGRRGVKRARRFSWDRLAADTVAVLEEIAR